MTASWRPDLYFGVSFNADPGDVGAVPIWSDLSVRFRTGNQLTRGRQYELNETQAGSPTATLLDIDEYLNPANTSSPYWPNVIPNRYCLFQAIWPQSTAGNMLNTAAPIAAQPPTNLTMVAGLFYDGSFESYTVGAEVPWLMPIGNEILDPVVSTTTPHSGAQDVTYVVAVDNGVQGMAWPVPCVPGRQYTSSAYVRQTTANTQGITVIDQNQVIDGFNRTTASGLGTADYGGAWTVSGTAANYSTAPGATATPWLGSASQSNAAVNTVHLSTAGSCVDSIQRVLVTAPVSATGGEIDIGLVSRFADASNYFFAELRFNTDSTIRLRVQKRVAGTTTSLATATMPFTYIAGSQFWLRFETSGLNGLQAWAWPDGAVPPLNYTVAFEQGVVVTATDTAITAAGAVGVRSVLDAANTNTLPVAVIFQQYTAIGSVVGSTTTTTGAYVRLSVTWTATQPVHYVQVATNASGALAGTVLVDDVQHEEAASASTFTTSGPVLYTVFRGNVDRWPSTWQADSQGFEGLATLTLVDGFAILNRYGMLAAYPTAVLATNPAYWWPLWDEAGSVSYAEVTGNGPALVNLSSKAGAGTLPAAGTDMAIVGDPGGTGVTFTPGATPGTTTAARTAIAAGALAKQASLPLPLVLNTSWAVTVAAWVRLTENSQTQVIAGLVTGSPLLIYTILLTATGTFIENNVSGTLFSANSSPLGNVKDGLLHHVVGTVIQDSTNTILYWWVDGALLGSNTVATSTLGGVQTAQSTTVVVGANTSAGYVYSMANGDIADVAVWNRAIGEVVDLYQAGLGWVNETSAQRIWRYVGNNTLNTSFGVSGAFNGPIDIDFNALSVMGADVLTTGTDTLTACQAVATTENGVFWAAPTALTFAGRETRYLQTSPTYIFGEDTVGGELPYQPNAVFDYDLTLVFNPVRVTNADGIVATASNATFARRFSPQLYPRDVNVADDNEAIDAANYLLNQHKQPTQRVANLALNPAAYPTLWPVVLGIEVGTRVTVKRRAKAANSGAGLTMSADYFVEQISHDSIDMAASTWLTTLQLSPVDVSQVWILEDATYGVLDQTTVLGY